MLGNFSNGKKSKAIIVDIRPQIKKNTKFFLSISFRFNIVKLSTVPIMTNIPIP